MKKIMRNEDAPFYFEKLFAGICFLDLLDKKSSIAKIEIKPDRKDGSDRRIEDLTKYYKDGSIEVIQIKHKTGHRKAFPFGQRNPLREVPIEDPPVIQLGDRVTLVRLRLRARNRPIGLG